MTTGLVLVNLPRIKKGIFSSCFYLSFIEKKMKNPFGWPTQPFYIHLSAHHSTIIQLPSPSVVLIQYSPLLAALHFLPTIYSEINEIFYCFVCSRYQTWVLYRKKEDISHFMYFIGADNGEQECIWKNMHKVCVIYTHLLLLFEESPSGSQI